MLRPVTGRLMRRSPEQGLDRACYKDLNPLVTHMDKSLVLIGLTLFTLLVGLAIAFYQLWSADKAQKEGDPSALAARYGGQPIGKPRHDPVNDVNPHVPAIDPTRPATGVRLNYW